MAEEKVKEEEQEKEQEKQEPFLGTWKTKEVAEEGLSNLQATLDRQGAELGALRKQVEVDQQLMGNMNQKPAEPTKQAVDYSKDKAAIKKEMAALDPADEDYQGTLLDLMSRSEALTAKEVHEKTLDAATKAFKQELDDRDVKATHNSFYEKNPDFNTPDMQARIQDYLSRDTTGMSDPLVAYREIQRDDAAEAKTILAKENEELKRLLDLKKGEEETGKVVTKGQSPAQQKNKVKATGADLDKGMLDALRNA